MARVLRFLLSQVLVIVCHLAVLLLSATASQSDSSMAMAPHCPSKCGSVDIPYPFGVSADCAWPGGGNFTIDCNHSFNPPRPYTNNNVEITSISVETGEMRVYAIVASVCYNSSHTTDFDQSFVGWTLDPPFVISPAQNVFTAIGCDNLAFLEGGSDWNYFTGCISYCVSLEDSARDGDPCTGLGCCQTSIPGNLSTIQVGWSTDNNTAVNNSAWEYSPCKHAFVAEKGWYNFSRQDLGGRGKYSFRNRVGDRSAPLVLDWAIRGNGSCQIGVSGKLTAPACASAHSYCQDLNATRGGGYLCKCSDGYMGNPYIINGCTNINECSEVRQSNSTRYGPCGPNSTCKDTDGDYICKCKFNRKGDGKSEEGCDQYVLSPYGIAGIALAVAIILACVLVTLLQRRKLRKLSDKNGRKILLANGITMYSERELNKITNPRKFLGGGKFGKVYEGRIDGTPAQQVAVKYSVVTPIGRHWPKAEAGSILRSLYHLGVMILKLIKLSLSTKKQVAQQEQDDDGGFVNEIIFQFKIRHINVVKLLGCCLETNIPVLVFEFVSNGSLEKRLHDGDKRYSLSLLKRLDIAIGSAEALSHIHSHGDHVHGDVKTANILLDDDLNPKVSDFGSSKLLSVKRYVMAVPADRRYIDPVYMKTDHFTMKSDVYSFGVVLLELITRKTAIYDGNISLPLEFAKCLKKEGSGRRMYDAEVFSGDDAQSQRNMECLDSISMLAVRCHKEDPEERPTMAEVVEELKQVKAMACGGSSSSEAN